MEQVLLIYNPGAGAGVVTMHLDKVIAGFAEREILVLPFRLGGPVDLDRALTELPMRTFSKIVIAGGDGTINLVVNNLVKRDIHTPIAILPAGTANDLASLLGIPSTIDGMIETALGDHYTKLDVGIAGSHYFVNVLAIGMLVDISQKTDPIAKNTLGLLAYYLRGLAELPFARATQLRIRSAEMDIDTKVSAVIIMNGRSAGGFKNVAPFSEVSDGLLDVIVFKRLILPDLLPVLFSVMAGQHTKNKHVVYFKTSRLRIESDVPEVNTDVDGERGDQLPLDVGILPSRLLVNTPPV
ncbi:lipid kinase [Clostridia bacterium]|nr:lipid kinase [Clostridia bacterium]